MSSQVAVRCSSIATMVVLALTVAACPPTPKPTVPEPPAKVPKGPVPGEVVFPSVQSPPVRVGRAPKVDLRALPKGARARLSSHDMGRIFVTLPPRRAGTVEPRKVFENVLYPILRATNFQRGSKGFAIPRNAMPQPRPRLAGMAQLLADEYRGNDVLIRKRSFEMIDAFLGKREPNDGVKLALRLARGMSFSQFKADIERLEIVYPFQQVDGDVPIEHTVLLASRWEGQTVTSVRGTIIHNYSVANKRPQDDKSAAKIAYSSLAKIKGIDRVGRRILDGPSLVLLPHGNDTSGGVSLRYAWRMILEATSLSHAASFITWVDAETGAILKMESLVSDVRARGETWRRDPGSGATRQTSFAVDAADNSTYTLKLTDVVNRVDYLADGYDTDDVSISDSANGSSSTLANFDQNPINDGTNAVCSSGGNVTFQQVNYFALFHSNWKQSIYHGIFEPFPTSPWSPRIESASAGCNAWSSMDFGACQGYYDTTCPNYSDGSTAGANYMNFAHDNTVVSHELAHNSVDRFTYTRPADWCGSTPCSVPVGWASFHDLADAWADHFENTNCTAGWVAKNLGGADASNNCQGTRGHVEGGGLPRLHEVTVPFNPATPGDHFPEHRDFGGANYPDMHMAAAALWQVRQGMRSKCRPSGHPQYFVRFIRALKNTGFFGASPGDTDRGAYTYLYDLELEMIEQWATSGLAGGPPAFRHNGNHTTNKVLAGFAKTGVFPIPAECIDGDASTSNAGVCPTGENGAAAVVDIDDNDLADDPITDGITHFEHDFLELGGVAPTFHVWTGSRFTFSGNDARPVTGTAPCNTKYQVEVSTDAAFPGPSTVTSGWINVDTDTSTADTPECYGTWSPDEDQWPALQTGGALSRIYYRVRTRDANDANEQISTAPAGGLWTVPPPYAVLTTNGQSDY